MKITIPIILFLFSVSNSQGQEYYGSISEDSLKGSITEAREGWNVLKYDIQFELDIKNRSLTGQNSILFSYDPLRISKLIQIDLQDPLRIDSIYLEEKRLSYKKKGSAYFIEMPSKINKNTTLDVYYSGKPKISFNPPYDGGFIFENDSLGREWISVACQMVGGSVWFPCKDHYSEEPDQGATVAITIADQYGVVVGNGKLSSYKNQDGRSEYTWSVSNPINNYGLSFYIGHYININQNYQGENGALDLSFWVLDYNREKAESHLIPETIKTISALEYWFGPYPFYEDGFKMVESSYIGMEHQSGIAYGNKFKKGRFSFNNLTTLDLQTDRLIVHETAHEWFGNNITMSDIADRWVQEGFAAYGEELFIEQQLGREAGREFYISRIVNKLRNNTALISPYGIFKDAGQDMYFKGWGIVHTLREIRNNDAEFRAYLRGLNKEFHHKNIYSKDLESYTSKFFKTDYSKFFNQYLRYPDIPILLFKMKGKNILFQLKSDVPGLEMEVELEKPDLRIKAGPKWKKLPLRGVELDEIKVNPNYLVGIRIND